MLIFIVLLTFSSLALTVMSIYWLFVRPTNTVAARLDVVDPDLAILENNPLTTMTRAAEPLNRIVPISAVEAAKLEKKLMHAGFASPDAAMAYRAIQILFPFFSSDDCRYRLFFSQLVFEQHPNVRSLVSRFGLLHTSPNFAKQDFCSSATHHLGAGRCVRSDGYCSGSWSRTKRRT